MKVILAMVTSLDGKSTKGNESPSKWSSKEDQVFFSKLIKKTKVMIIGRKTYEAIKNNINLDSKTLRIIMTKDAKKYKQSLRAKALQKQEIPGKLEFSDYSPVRLYDDLKTRGFREVLLLSGEKLNSQFFKFNLINEVWITLEPKIFGKGKGVIDQALNIDLKLKSITKLNMQGTLLLKYSTI